MRTCLLFVIALSASLASCVDTLSPKQFYQELQNSTACSAGDTCVAFRPDIKCLCPSVVNSRELDRLNGLEAKVDCAGAEADCASIPTSPRCENGVCTGDTGWVNPTDGGTSDSAGD